MYKIKTHKKTNQIEILCGKSIVFAGDTQAFINLSTDIMEFITKEKFHITSPTERKESGRMKGIYNYHLAKNIILSALNDFKKTLKRWQENSHRNK